MTNDLTVQRQNDLELCDAMLEQTSSSVPKILCKKGEWSKGGEDISAGKEFIAYPMDAMRDLCRWDGDHVVEQRIGHIADKFALKREDLPEDEDWNRKWQCRLKTRTAAKLSCLFRALSAAKSQSKN